MRGVAIVPMPTTGSCLSSSTWVARPPDTLSATHKDSRSHESFKSGLQRGEWERMSSCRSSPIIDWWQGLQMMLLIRLTTPCSGSRTITCKHLSRFQSPGRKEEEKSLRQMESVDRFRTLFNFCSFDTVNSLPKPSAPRCRDLCLCSEKAGHGRQLVDPA
jgi:hypothetical protein